MNYTTARCGHLVIAEGAPGSRQRKACERRTCGDGENYTWGDVRHRWESFQAGAAWAAAQSKGEHDDDGK